MSSEQSIVSSATDQAVPGTTGSETRVLLEVTGNVPRSPRPRYIDQPFRLPAGASKVGAIVSFNEPLLLYLSLHDAAGLRGNRMNPGAKGQIDLELWVAPDRASEGGIVGALPEGDWLARLNLRRLGEDTSYRLVVYAEFELVPQPLVVDYPSDHVVHTGPGWYKGELHAHSTESDGKYPVETVIQAAINAELDFISLTDHYTHSQWDKMAVLANERTALLRSCELTDVRGHANLQGISESVDVFVGRNDWSMNEAADATRAQGGLFCVNHAFSGYLGWRSDDFDWNKADLLEVYHNLEGPNNNLLLPLWDHHLRLGRRIVGVGGIDSHDPFDGLHKLGQLVTWIDAPELSERGIIAGLRRGRVYVSREPELRLTAGNSRGERAEMWETLPLDSGPITLELQIKSGQALHVFVLKNGYPFEMQAVDALPDTWQTLSFADEPTLPGYYRVEIHSMFPGEQSSKQWRDWTTMQALSNPLWVA